MTFNVKTQRILKSSSIILSLLILLTILPLEISTLYASEVTSNIVTGDVATKDIVADATLSEDIPYRHEELASSDSQRSINIIPTNNENLQTHTDYDLNTIITDNGDGTHTMTLYDFPVKYINSEGEVEKISLEVVSAPDGSYRTKDNDIQTVFPKKISDGISLLGRGINIKLKPLASIASLGNITTTNNATQIFADATVTKLDNTTVSYCYDNNTTLEYSLTYLGFKEYIVVSEYTGQTDYTFLLETDGLILTKTNESYYLTNENGDIKATLGDIIIFTADERNNTIGSMTHTAIKEGQQYMITIHVDAAYLKDKNTIYPIRIDPTIEITHDNNGTGAIQDVTLNELSGSSGSSGSIYVGKRGTCGISRTLMKFPGLNLSVIPSANSIISACVEIRDLLCETTSMTVYPCIFVGNEWTESSAQWATVEPNFYTEIANSYVTVSYSNGASNVPVHRYSINITPAVKSWKTGFHSQAKGIMLKANDSIENSNTTLYKTFASYVATNTLDSKGEIHT